MVWIPPGNSEGAACIDVVVWPALMEERIGDATGGEA